MKKIIAILVFCFLSGCGSKRIPVEPDIDSLGAMIGNNIAESAETIHRDLKHLERIREANSSGWNTYKTPKTGPLSRKITLKFNGPVDEAANVLAQLIGYDFKVSGKKPTPPRIIQIDAVESAAFSVIEDMGLQAGESVGLLLDEKQETLVLNYRTK